MGQCVSRIMGRASVVDAATVLLGRAYVSDDDLMQFHAVIHDAGKLTMYELYLFIRVERHADLTRGEDTVDHCLKLCRIPMDHVRLLEKKLE